MENILYMYAIVTMLLWLTGLAIAVVIFRFMKHRSKAGKQKFWIERKELQQY